MPAIMQRKVATCGMGSVVYWLKINNIKRGSLAGKSSNASFAIIRDVSY